MIPRVLSGRCPVSSLFAGDVLWYSLPILRRVYEAFLHRYLLIALALHLVLLAVFVSLSSVKDFLYLHTWLLGMIAALPDIAVAVLAWFELGHSAEANRLRRDANEARAESNEHLARANALQAELDAARNEVLRSIAENTKQPTTWAEKNAAKLRRRLGEGVAVQEGIGGWGFGTQIVEVTEDNIPTLFMPVGFGSSQAWSQQIECAEMEITEPPKGPMQIKIRKRYGNVISLGEIKRYEDRYGAAAIPGFVKGDMAYYAGYAKQGTSERRTLIVTSSADKSNSFLLEASTGERLIGDNIEISKRFAMLDIEYKAAGFTRSNSSSGTAAHPLYIL